MHDLSGEGGRSQQSGDTGGQRGDPGQGEGQTPGHGKRRLQTGFGQGLHHRLGRRRRLDLYLPGIGKGTGALLAPVTCSNLVYSTFLLFFFTHKGGPPGFAGGTTHICLKTKPISGVNKVPGLARYTLHHNRVHSSNRNDNCVFHHAPISQGPVS